MSDCGPAGSLRAVQAPQWRRNPAMHKHAGDTTIHAPSPQHARSILDGCVVLRCRAIAGQIPGHRPGLVASHLRCGEPIAGVPCQQVPQVSATWASPSRDEGAAREGLYTRILQQLRHRILGWAPPWVTGQGLHSQQMLLSASTYQAPFRQDVPLMRTNGGVEEIAPRYATQVAMRVHRNREPEVVATRVHAHNPLTVTKTANSWWNRTNVFAPCPGLCGVCRTAREGVTAAVALELRWSSV